MKVGWYIHHQGVGHLQRFLQMRAYFTSVVALSSLPRPVHLPADAWLQLADDTPVAPGVDTSAGGSLHWAPLRHAGMRTRMAQIAEWIARAQPDVFVVDVSAEVAIFVRLMGVPVVWVAQRGRREDKGHRRAYAAASAIVAPWSWATQHDELGAALPPGAQLVGALSRFDGRPPRPAPREGRVLAMFGSGGHTVTPADIAAAKARTPDWSWSVHGGPGALAGDADAVWEALQDCDVVVASAGSNVVAEIAAARRPAVLIPQPRRCDEQLEQARALAASGLVEVHERWPRAGIWPAILDRARRRDPED